MKLVIQIPALNEEESLPATLADLPRSVPGFDEVAWLLIDDGSTDRTVEVARAHGIDHVVSLPRRQGLAAAFRTGLDAALGMGADVIVNTDADNQYVAADIPALVAPVLSGAADIVVGARPIRDIGDFSILKKLLQRLGSWAVRQASGTSVPDAPSGFRAFSRAAALRLHLFTRYTYTLETLIQAGRKGLVVGSVPIRVNRVERPSRLMRGMAEYVFRSMWTIGWLLLIYQPVWFTAFPGFASLFGGTLLGARFLGHYLAGDGDGHVQSLILAAVLLLAGFVLLLGGILAELVATNRMLMEDIQSRVRAMELGQGFRGGARTK